MHVLVQGVLVRGVVVRGVTVRGVTVRGVVVRGVLVRGVLVQGVLVRGVLVLEPKTSPKGHFFQLIVFDFLTFQGVYFIIFLLLASHFDLTMI